MSVYVDPLAVFGGNDAPRCFRHKSSCHMYADTEEELHEFARKLGLRREWFQNSPTVKHYDLTALKRSEAVLRGAIQHTRREAVNKWRELRGQEPLL